MNMQLSNYRSSKKYNVKSVKTENYNETNKRPREEFAKEFLRAYDRALKIATGETPRNKNAFAEDMENWLKIAEEMEKDEY